MLGAVNNSLTNGECKPIQVQTMDITKCIDKLLLEATINALYEAGLKSDVLNLLYNKNENADIAIKVRTERINLKKIVMQGSVRGGLKCTTLMDKLNKLMMKKDTLVYNYLGDPHIGIGVS